ncbi:prolyl oligopeptidase [Xanthomonas translucens pv. phlei]|uniref:Prolyl oligopeptidase n=1 Tax=Xanthomonas graminis pv. phlei TaxID=487906 RepID=A0A0K3A2J1_9XANT|nr:hypothetical protein [Xanthomonas translucens]CTP90644.1 prolyl oligopeptidase [Xanthomonas translucens pv. phlei]
MGSAQAQVDLAPFLKQEQVGELKLSPTGEFYAATVPLADRTALAVMRRSDSKIVGTFSMEKNTHVSDFVWVNDTRVLFSLAQKMGARDQPWGTGELFAINADGGAAELLVGQRVTGNGPGTLIQTKWRRRRISHSPTVPRCSPPSWPRCGRSHCRRATACRCTAS